MKSASIVVLAEWKATHGVARVERTVAYPAPWLLPWALWSAWVDWWLKGGLK